MKKEYLVSFNVEGMFAGGSSYITVEDGRVDTQAVEDEFYAILRKNERGLIADAEESEREAIIDSLSPEQEDILKGAHAEDYNGTDDDMPDAYEDWLMDLELIELKTILGL